MKINPKAAEPVRMMTTAEGKFLSLDDMKARLGEEGVLDEALGLVAYGHKIGDDPRKVIKHAIGEFIACCANEMPKTDGIEQAYSSWLGRGRFT
jgi:hypothetical protein